MHVESTEPVEKGLIFISKWEVAVSGINFGNARGIRRGQIPNRKLAAWDLAR